VCILPAVSIKTTSILFVLAYLIASKATALGSEPYSCFITFTPNLFPCNSSCSIEAALNVSAAASIQDNLFFCRIWQNLAILVVLPAPLIPKNNILKGS